ncbi:hypothetical protein [Fictibacillus terranigra]|uniref:Phage protein n=1 Tax=Fictibacillus terranigra TaxID=3058424 RepID=A0ABT8E8U0_9BACL|nr:hypothetical protein [Fictibacillus sp. CENA-BCM004]MDN4074319.1 hypothetical protein [Fictibacillus sp. CENA-BCM004]
MDIDLLNNIITNVVTLAVGTVGAIVGYKAAIKGAKMQIENEHKKLQEAVEEQAEFTKSAIENFIRTEIDHNFSQIKFDEFKYQLQENEAPFPYYFHNSEIDFTYEEFNSLKYEIIKFESPQAKELISIYDMFRLIERKQDVEFFTQLQYDEFKKTYFLCYFEYSLFA